MESGPNSPERDVNLGLFDGEVSHAEVNQTIALADKAVLFGEQTRLPYFPEDVRLPKLHAGDPLVLLFWKVLKKIPETLRVALLEAPLSLTLIRGEELLFFTDFRRHQALHIGCRRRAIYLPEVLLHAAEDKGYDYWAIAEGVIYAGWMLLDYLLLVDVLKAYAEQARKLPGYRLGELLQRKLVTRYNRHRRDSADAGRSEIREFLDGYRVPLLEITGYQAMAAEPFALARELFDPELEQRWARDKMERIAQVFNFPQMFLFDRDIIHGVAGELALNRGQEVEPQSFADVLHDYRDALRFELRPLMTTFGKGLVPKPRAVFLQQVVALGSRGLRGFFEAYREDQPEVRKLMHPLWMHLCSLSSDPAGVFSRAGRCRALVREGIAGDIDAPLAGILIRLDRAPNYPTIVAEVAAMGKPVREELVSLVGQQRLEEEDGWEIFKVRKQGIVKHACEALEKIEGNGAVVWKKEERINLHEDEGIQELLADNPHRLTSDPNGLLLYLRAYRRSLEEFGPDDPDSDFLLAAVLIRLDKSDHYPRLLEQIQRLGTPAFSALHGVFEQIPEQDLRRRTILKQARVLWSRMVAQSRSSSRKGSR